MKRFNRMGGLCVLSGLATVLSPSPVGAQQSWQNLGGGFTLDFFPAATFAGTAVGTDIVDVYAVAAADGSLLVNSLRPINFASTWIGWTNLGPQCASSPTAVVWPLANGSQHREVFVLGTDRALYHQYAESSVWTGWQFIGMPAGKTLCGDPSAVSWEPGRIDVFVDSCDNPPQLEHTWVAVDRSCVWCTWDSPAGSVSSVETPIATSQASQVLDVFVKNSNNELWDVSWNATRGWANIDTGLNGNSSSTAAAAGGALYVFVEMFNDGLSGPGPFGLIPASGSGGIWTKSMPVLDAEPALAVQQGNGTNPEVFWFGQGGVTSYVWNGGTNWTNTSPSNQPTNLSPILGAVRGAPWVHFFALSQAGNVWVTDDAQ
jgi:hypothetical protein